MAKSNYNIGFVGNRINLFGEILLGSGALLKSLGERFSENDFFPNQIMILGAGIMLISSFGIGTKKIYERTKEHIISRGKLDERYMRNLIRGAQDEPPVLDRFLGYCQLQGAYLAARETGNVEDFDRYKRKYSKNILPNF